MGTIYIPEGYKSPQTIKETEIAIKEVKDYFERALADALNLGRIAGAGVDVLSTEPPKADNPLLSCKNCFITPHIAWAGYETRERLVGVVLNNLKSYLDGNPVNVVNK